MRHVWRGCDHPRWQLISLPRTYFESKDVRPSENEGQFLAPIFASKGISIPEELNQGVLEFLTGKVLLRFAKVSKTTLRIVRKCKALLFDAVHERIDNFVGQYGGHEWVGAHRRQVNSHRFRTKNRVRVIVNGDQIDGYCVGVTPKYLFYVHLKNIFDGYPNIERVKSKSGVVHVHPYTGNVAEVVQQWRVESRFRGSAS